MPLYEIGTDRVYSNDPGLEAIAAQAYAKKTRPLCMCRTPGIEMYVAKVGADRHVIKRMPNSGSKHATDCDSYELPPELSGLGQLAGTAIQENIEDGTTALKFAFSLSKGAARKAPVPSDKEADSVKTDGNKLTLRGTLHYLWEQAQFNVWKPSMAGKRGWYVMRKYLYQAALSMTAKGNSISQMLYIPESYNLEKKAEIEQRRMASMAHIAQQGKTRSFMLVVGEVKEIAPSKYGFKIILKHSPAFHFMLNEDIHKRMHKRFESEIELANAIEGSHLMMIATFSLGPTGVASIEELALMCVTENWIPFDGLPEKNLLDALTQQGRSFFKCLRYNLPSTKALASAVLTDTQPSETALYLLPPGAADEYGEGLDMLKEESSLPSWTWDAGSEPMPTLPEKAR